jgi:hypothetical protein
VDAREQQELRSPAEGLHGAARCEGSFTNDDVWPFAGEKISVGHVLGFGHECDVLTLFVLHAFLTHQDPRSSSNNTNE